jgi:hypothetical protein
MEIKKIQNVLTEGEIMDTGYHGQDEPEHLGLSSSSSEEEEKEKQQVNKFLSVQKIFNQRIVSTIEFVGAKRNNYIG